MLTESHKAVKALDLYAKKAGKPGPVSHHLKTMGVDESEATPTNTPLPNAKLFHERFPLSG